MNAADDNQSAPEQARSPDDAPIVVHVLDRFGIGGMESVALTLIERTLDRYRHHVICLRDTGDMASRVRALGVTIESVDKKPGKDIRAYRRLHARLRSLAPAIVHTYNIGALDVAVWARLAGVRRVVHAEHGRDVSDPEGRNVKYRWLRRAMAPLISVFVPVSADLQRWLLEDVRIPRSRVRLIRNGIDTERYAPTQVAESGEHSPLHIGTVGRLDAVKGFDYLIAAFAALVSSRESSAPDLHLTLVGEGPERHALEAQITELELDTQVTLAGSRDDIPEFLHTLDVYVCSSIAEGIALTVLEAMAAARPIVATAVGGNPELIDDGHTGRLIASGDIDMMSRAIAALLDDPAHAQALGHAARERVCDRFSVAAMIEGYCALYDDLIGQRGKTVCVD